MPLYMGIPGYSVGWNRGLGYTPLNSRFRDFRKFFHQTIGSRAAQEKRVQEAQEHGVRGLLLRLLIGPSQFREHFRQWVVFLSVHMPFYL